VGHRTQGLLGVVLESSSLSSLTPELVAALERLPDRFDPAEWKVWNEFFERFCTHWVDEAVVGGRIQV
jgi:hypothetical protein